jgi:hypothetical protein
MDKVRHDADDEATLLANADLAGSFYHALRDQKMPEDLCADLVRDWHWSLYFDGADDE